MVSLASVYGNKIFNRKASYASSGRITYVGMIVIDLILAYVITELFDVRWDYAFLKVLGLLFLFESAKKVITSILDMIVYRLVTKRVMVSEIRHYLSLFDHPGIDWDEIGTYGDYLLEAAFNESLPTNLRVLAAINYSSEVHAIELGFNYDTRSWRLFSQVAPEFIEHQKNQGYAE